MEFREVLVSPKGREYVARTEVESNDLKARGYVVKPVPVFKPRPEPKPVEKPALESKPVDKPKPFAPKVEDKPEDK